MKNAGNTIYGAPRFHFNIGYIRQWILYPDSSELYRFSPAP